jgi:prephenate dehydrogenase
VTLDAPEVSGASERPDPSAGSAGSAGSTLWDQIDSTVTAGRVSKAELPAAELRTGLSRVLIVGSGLIGTSIALALREQGVDVVLEDTSAGRLALAVELGAGRPREAADRFDLAVVAVPPDVVAVEVNRLQRLNLSRTYTDVTSSKAQPLAELQSIAGDMSTFLGSHPVAGREQQGPAAAHADLFIGRPWVLTPTSDTTATAESDVRALILACGATAVVMSAEDHDAALAAVSHLPHVVASVLAAQLAARPDSVLGLGGTGLADTTRIAAGDPALWTQILVSNASHIAEALVGFSRDVSELTTLLSLIANGDRSAVERLTAVLIEGKQGRDRIPAKRGERAADFVTVPIVVRDAPGELAALLRACGEAKINVEDVHVDHQPGRPLGVVDLSVRADAVASLVQALREKGWQVYS